MAPATRRSPIYAPGMHGHRREALPHPGMQLLRPGKDLAPSQTRHLYTGLSPSADISLPGMPMSTLVCGAIPV